MFDLNFLLQKDLTELVDRHTHIMRPIQLKKTVKASEGRRLLLSGSENAADAAFQMGYESPTQFSREYSRMFDFLPKEDMKRFKSNS